MTETNGILEIIGGLSLILYGIHLSGVNLQKILGSHLEMGLKKASSNPLKGIAIGAGITSLIHSSGTTTVMLIGLITGGFMSLGGAVPVMLGANIGSTVATQLASLRIGNYALLFLIWGVITHILSEKKINKRIGEAIIGFSFLFLGMNFLFLGMEFCSKNEIFIEIVQALTSSPERALCAGAFLTAFLRSASATSILAVSLGATSVISLPTALFLILGISIGSGLKVLRLALSGKNFSGKLALIHFSINGLGVSVFFVFFQLFYDLVLITADEPGRQIANAYTLYNIIAAIIFIPFISSMIKIIEKFSPSTKTLKKSELFYLDKKLICTPSVSLAQANRGVVEMTKIAYEMLETSRTIYFENKLDSLVKVEQRENKIDDMTEKISEYTVQISQQNLNHEDVMKLYSLMHIVADIEHLCDHILSISKLFANLKNEKRTVFSEKAQSELTAVYGKLRIIQTLVVKALDENNAKLANEVIKHENKIDEIIKKISANHEKRFQNGLCDETTGKYFTEILYHLERIGDHYDNIAYAVIDRFRREERN
ncbi:MAG: Na/Pi cotransporter family protein [Candidatus Paceibacterota bacterium]